MPDRVDTGRSDTDETDTMIQSYFHHIERKSDLPAIHAAFLKEALPRLQADERIVAVAAGGAFLTGGMDEYSDLDLVIAVSPSAVPQVRQERHQIASTLGSLLTAFAGGHVGEPRLLICLYGPPLLHVDLKFIQQWERLGTAPDAELQSLRALPALLAGEAEASR
jgi:predicted nucleotidyltransferase